MRALVAYTLRSLRANKARTLVTVAGVALAAALLAAVLSTFTSLVGSLYETELSRAGSWMVAIDEDYSPEFEAEILAAEEDDVIGQKAIFQDVGFGELTAKQKGFGGTYLPILTFQGDLRELCAIEPSEGRLPENSRELLLPEHWERRGLEIDQSFTIPVGQRVARLAPGESGVMEYGVADAATGEELDSGVITDGTELDSSMGYLEVGDGGRFSEELVDLNERTFEIVGFYNAWNRAVSFNTGLAALTYQELQSGAATTVYATTASASTNKEISERIEECFPNASVSLHGSLLRYGGVSFEGAIWSTFVGIVATLAVVIIVVCVALICNAFAIAVTERTAQYALLRSIGASRRQLRRSVMLEALLIACVGIPLGIVVGVGGTFLTLRILGPSIATLVGNPTATVGLVLSPGSLGATALLTLITVLVSAFIPAWRCGRSNIIESLRGAQMRRSSAKGARDAAKHTSASQLWKTGGLGRRIFGVGGTLARINGKRGTARGTMASISLALAILLLMTAGSLNVFLGTLVNAASDDPGVDLSVGVSLGYDPGEEASLLSAYEEGYEALASVPGAEPRGWSLNDSVDIILPESMVGSSLSDSQEVSGEGGAMADGSFAAIGGLRFIDDATFDDLARAQGQDPTPYHDPSSLKAIAMGRAFENNGQKYVILDLLRQPGVVRILTGGTSDGQPLSGFNLAYDGETETCTFEPYLRNEDGVAAPAEGEIHVDELAIDVAAIATEPLPGIRTSQLALLMPAFVAPTVLEAFTFRGSADSAPYFTASFDAPGGDHGMVSEELEDAMKGFFTDIPGHSLHFYIVTDVVEARQETQMIVTVVNVFCLLFTVILALIALANVFNTITNSLTLRRQEFAVMGSIGMTSRQLHGMVAQECVSFGLRGFLPGMVLSVLVSYLLFWAVDQSVTGMAFTFPWGYGALATAMTLVAMLIAVAFGMHRCRADNPVEALRTTSI